MTRKITEAMIKDPVTVVLPTHTGSRTIHGRITTPMAIREDGSIEAATLEGTVILERITGMPLPLEPDELVRIELLPIAVLV